MPQMSSTVIGKISLSIFFMVGWALLGPTFAVAQDAGVCGEAPPVADEGLKGEIDAHVQALSKFLGDAQLEGKIEKSKREIFSHYPDAEKSRSNAYFEHMTCEVILSDKTLTTDQKLQEIVKMKKAFAGTVSNSGKDYKKISPEHEIASVSKMSPEEEAHIVSSVSPNLNSPASGASYTLRNDDNVMTISIGITMKDIGLYPIQGEVQPIVIETASGASVDPNSYKWYGAKNFFINQNQELHLISKIELMPIFAGILGGEKKIFDIGVIYQLATPNPIVALIRKHLDSDEAKEEISKLSTATYTNTSQVECWKTEPGNNINCRFLQ